MIIIPFLLITISYIAYDYVKDLPFHYITQSNYTLCDKMNGSFCTRIAYLVMAIIVYFITIECLKITSTWQNTPIVKNALTNDKVSNFGYGALIGGSIAMLAYIANNIFGFIDFKKYVSTSWNNILTILSGMILTGFTEEIIFRGLLIGGTKLFINSNISLLLSSLIFGYIHMGYSLVYGIAAFIKGILLGFGYLKYGLYWSAGLHAIFNFVETTLYTITKTKVVNKIMGGERKTPDDDGFTSSLIDMVFLYGLFKFY